MIFWRFVQGLVLPPIFAVTIAYIGGEMPADEATGMTGTYVMGAALGGFTGRLLTGLLAEPIGWRNAFLVDAVLTALLAIAVIVLLPREKNFVRAANLKASLKQMVKHLRNPKLMATYAVGFGVLFNFIATFTFISFHLAAPPIQSFARRARVHLHRLSRRHLHRAAGRPRRVALRPPAFCHRYPRGVDWRHIAHPRAVAHCGDRRA